MIHGVRPALGWLLQRSPAAPGALTEPFRVVLIVIMFLAAWVAEEIGIHAVFGAFLAGAILPRTEGLAPQVMTLLDDVTSLILLPIFFAVFGLSTRIDRLDRPVIWGITALVMAAAVAGKWGGSRSRRWPVVCRCGRRWRWGR